MAISTPFLFEIDAVDRAALEARWSVHRHEAEEMIVAHDEPGRDVFFVLEGRARATVFSSGGRAIANRDIEPGGIFGELAAIDGRTRSASIVALGTMMVARLPEAGFRDLVNTRPGFTWALLHHLSSQMRRMTDRIYEFNTLVVRKRLRSCSAWNGGMAADVALIGPAQALRSRRDDQHAKRVARDDAAKLGLIKKRGSMCTLRRCTPSRIRTTDSGKRRSDVANSVPPVSEPPRQ
jgi:signal-transduction protein with cAMP-binding, CBS, and nucleotidyltransferase domain